MTSINLRGSGLRSSGMKDDNFEPMASVGNIADAMLVFAVSLMMAVLTYWQLDLPQVTEVIEESEITEVGEMENMVDDFTGGGSKYAELGKVYMDPQTGKMYMLTEDLPEGANAAMADTPTDQQSSQRP